MTRGCWSLFGGFSPAPALQGVGKGLELSWWYRNGDGDEIFVVVIATVTTSGPGELPVHGLGWNHHLPEGKAPQSKGKGAQRMQQERGDLEISNLSKSHQQRGHVQSEPSLAGFHFQGSWRLWVSTLQPPAATTLLLLPKICSMQKPKPR